MGIENNIANDGTALMERLHLMSLAVAEESGCAGAARRLGKSPSAVTRAIDALEQRLGVKLLSRSTRYLHITEAGQRSSAKVRRVSTSSPPR